VKYCWGESPSGSITEVQRDAYCLSDQYGLQLTFADAPGIWTIYANAEIEKNPSSSVTALQERCPQVEELKTPNMMDAIWWAIIETDVVEEKESQQVSQSPERVRLSQIVDFLKQLNQTFETTIARQLVDQASSLWSRMDDDTQTLVAHIMEQRLVRHPEVKQMAVQFQRLRETQQKLNRTKKEVTQVSKALEVSFEEQAKKRKQTKKKHLSRP
jgi:hypothetical protein